MKRRSVLLADREAVVRRGLCALFDSRPDLEVIAEAENGREAVRKAHELHPDLAILDALLPELNGVEAARQILRALPEARVLILASEHSDELVIKSLRAGAAGYVLRSEPEDELLKAVNGVLSDRIFISRIGSHTLLSRMKILADFDGTPDCLTAREREILQLLAEGHVNKQVADKLCVSVRTVEKHRLRIMHKLHFGSLSDLIRYAIRNKMIRA